MASSATAKPIGESMKMFILVASLLMTPLTLTVIDAGPQPGAFKHENTPANLQALFEHIRETAHDKRNPDLAATTFWSLVPDEPRLRKALADDAPADTVKKILAFYASLAATTRDGTKICAPEQRIVKVHGASTEELRKAGNDGVPEFPGGAMQQAGMLRPGVTFYEVEYLEQAKEDGMKYHLLYWDGRGWSMLGPVWRAMR